MPPLADARYRARWVLWAALPVLLWAWTAEATAADYRSVSTKAAVLFDAPSLQASRLYIATELYPLEVLVALEQWLKVRDRSGTIAWVRKQDVGARRTVVVSAAVAEVRQKPDGGSPLLLQAGKGVALDFLGAETNGWVKVKHADGTVGYARKTQLWGAD